MRAPTPPRTQRIGTTLRLWSHYLLLLGGLILIVQLSCALLYKLVLPFSVGFPSFFFEGLALALAGINLAALGLEWQLLRTGGGRQVARWLGGQPLQDDPDDALQRRLLNIVDELVQREAQVLPTVYLLPQEDSINAVVAGWSRHDLTLVITQGALDRLTRSELRALVAHAFARLRDSQAASTHLRLAMVWSLSWVHGQGQMMMRPGAGGRLHAISWLMGLGLTFFGWLGCLAGRTLQAASSRAAVTEADAAAVQITERRRDLGNVLRKLWHDHQMMSRGRLKHPCAGMLAFLAFHDPSEMPGLATHPTLPERVRRVLGQSLPPLPTSMLPGDDQEPRRSSAFPSGQGAEDRPLPAHADAAPATPEARRQARIAADREALQHMQLRIGPTEMRLTILALMMNPGNHRENKLWRRLAEDAPHAETILNDVRNLLPSSRLPEFERLVDRVAEQPLIHKRMLVEAARDLMRADGRVSPRERLWWLVLRHRLNDPGPATLMRPVTGQGQTLPELNLLERAYISTLTGYVARFVPEDAPPGRISEAGQRWWRGVLARCGEVTEAALDRPPDADALMHALSGVQELSWMMRPLLMAAWAEEALNHSPHGLLSDDTADALRLLSTLLDTPLPPVLASHYPKAA